MKNRWGPLIAGAFYCLAVCAACSPRDRSEPTSKNSKSDSSAALADSMAQGSGADSSGSSRAGIPAFLSPRELAATPEPLLSPEALAALAPPHLLLKDLGFNTPSVVPDTTGLKNKAKLQREWVEALLKYNRNDFVGTRSHFDRAVAFHAQAKGADLNWPMRFRNLDAALVYLEGPPGEVKRRFGEIQDPDPEDVLDVAFEWALLNDDLRLGRGREAVARLRMVQRSHLEASLEARKLMAKLFPEGVPGAPL